LTSLDGPQAGQDESETLAPAQRCLTRANTWRGVGFMAKPVVVTIEHGSSKEAVKEKLRGSLERIRGQLGPLVGPVDEQWAGDALQFRLAALGQPVTGRIDIGDRVVRIEVLLPGLLGYLGDKIAGRVQREGSRLLDKK